MAMQTSLYMLKMNTQELNEYLEELAYSNVVVDVERPSCIYKPSPFARNDTARPVYSDDDNDMHKEQFMHDKCAETSTRQELYFQLACMNVSAEENIVMQYLIESLDRNGFLTDTVEETAEILKKDVTLVRRCIAILRSMEPVGIGARNSIHCLHIQLDRLYPEEHTAHLILDSYLKKLAAEKYDDIAKALDLPLKEIMRSCKLIRTLNPKPLNGKGGETVVQYITPDFYVMENGTGGLDVIMNDYYLPKVQINPYYMKLVRDSSLGKADENYIKKDFAQANEVIRFLEYRVTTIQKVAEFMVGVQKDSFIQGPGHRRTLSNKQVAEALDLNESTVSRTISNKYFECKWGVFPMSRLLCHGVSPAGRDVDIEYDRILYLIREQIAQEPKESPHSDQQIADFLSKNGIAISRRTVAKYREQLGIPNSMQRKNKKSH